MPFYLLLHSAHSSFKLSSLFLSVLSLSLYPLIRIYPYELCLAVSSSIIISILPFSVYPLYYLPHLDLGMYPYQPKVCPRCLTQLGPINYLICLILLSVLAKYMLSPGHMHWNATRRVLQYLYHTHRVGITLGGDLKLAGYSNTDWAGNHNDRKSTTHTSSRWALAPSHGRARSSQLWCCLLLKLNSWL